MPIGSPASISRYSFKAVQLGSTEQKKPETKLWRAVLGQNAEFDPEYVKRKVRKKFAENFVNAINKMSVKVRR